ncbi:MAG: cytochrome b [Alphaproteobacteria bacterium]|nr:MAG: cytochrome b [Alphaproteobacteria bacterium]TAF15998.1 MAG: cytochrome b [Alphaproteobacteria bacterium]TAF39252.1 MAG: cytochrome b [Alphaproteobacteria bacterium]TAF76230.1 MAG: cytochrome b [Alphaproteobacteria bacterium]
MGSTNQPEQKGIIGWVDYRLPIFSTLQHTLVDYPTPRNLNYFWNFGSIAGIVLVSQILTGIFLAMHYTPHVQFAFSSVEHIMRDVNYGWLVRYMHANGASMFFLVVFIHIFRGLYYGSYKAPRELLWWLGIVILILMMASAFMGYVLPWGQMSFWGATVITNLFSAFPIVGESIVTWLWGGFSVDNPTLNRFFALHYLMPLILVAVVVLHLLALHQHGSNNPLGIDVKGKQDTVPFHPYYTAKDFFGFGVFFLVFGYFTFFAPNYLGHPDNYIEANPMVTPAHIVPEWYFLPFYAILRAITFNTPLIIPGIVISAFGLMLSRKAAKANKLSLFNPMNAFHPAMMIPMGVLGLGGLLVFTGIVGFTGSACTTDAQGKILCFEGIIESKLGGVLAMFGSLIVLFFLPWLDSSKVRSGNFRPMFRPFFWLFVFNGLFLGWMGAAPADGCLGQDAHACSFATITHADGSTTKEIATFWTNPLISQLATAYYFAYFLVILPILGRIEKPLPLPRSIGEAITKKHAKA